MAETSSPQTAFISTINYLRTLRMNCYKLKWSLDIINVPWLLASVINYCGHKQTDKPIRVNEKFTDLKAIRECPMQRCTL